MTVLGGGAFGRWLGHEGRALTNGNSALINDTPEIPLILPAMWGYIKKTAIGASLVVQWLRIHLPRQGTRVWALVREDPTCRGATKPVRHKYWALVPQLLKPAHLESVLHNKGSHLNEKPAHRNEE